MHDSMVAKELLQLFSLCLFLGENGAFVLEFFLLSSACSWVLAI